MGCGAGCRGLCGAARGCARGGRGSGPAAATRPPPSGSVTAGVTAALRAPRVRGPSSVAPSFPPSHIHTPGNYFGEPAPRARREGGPRPPGQALCLPRQSKGNQTETFEGRLARLQARRAFEVGLLLNEWFGAELLGGPGAASPGRNSWS